MKEERIRLRDSGRWIGQLERTNTGAWVRDQDGRRTQFSMALSTSESVLSELREPARFPLLALLRAELMDWRFYHRFRTDFSSPLRRPQPATRTAVLADDGRDVSAALQTIIESGDAVALRNAVDLAFPGSSLVISRVGSTFAMGLKMPEFREPLWQPELSDGMLHYLCLLAALLTTHSEQLADLVEQIVPINKFSVEKVNGETRFAGHGILGQIPTEGIDDQ